MDMNEVLIPTTPRLSGSEYCNQALQDAFGSCASEAERSLLACAIALVLPAQRPLKLRELHGAVAQYVFLRHACILNVSHKDFKLWIDTKTDLFTREEDNTMRFSYPAMPKFLRENAIRNVDTTHYTIALLCFTQKERYRQLQSVLPYSQHAFWFLDYAEQYWRYHGQRGGDFA